MVAAYLAIALLVPLVPLLTAWRYAFAPGGGPLLLVSFALFLGVPMKVAYTYLFASDLSAPWFQRPDSALEYALVYILLFMVLVSVGYALGMRREERFDARPVLRAQAIGPQATLVLLVVSVAMFAIVLVLLQSRKHGFSDLTDLLTFEKIADLNRSKLDMISRVEGFGKSYAFIFAFLGVIWFSFIVIVCSSLSDNRTRSHVAAVLILLALVLFESLIRGKRLSLINILLFFVIACYIVRGHISTKMWAGLAITFPVMFGVFTAMSVFRHFGADSGGIGLQQAADIAFMHVFRSTYFTDINNLATIMWRMEDHELLMGESFTRLVTSFIPREFWPDKPAISVGIFVRTEIYGVGRALGGINTPLPTEAYLNFGWGGVFVGVVYGFALRRFEVWCLSVRNVERYGSAWLYIFVVLPVTWVMMQSSFALAMTGAIVATVMALAIGIPAAMSARRREQPHGAASMGPTQIGRGGDGISTPAE